VIIVTGTKRSGTSMWMQLLHAAGFPPIGDAFPRNWETTIKDANPAGFWESELRRGIYYKTNPDPKTGVYLFPEDTRRHAVKVFIPGLIKTDRAFITKVVATVRPWRQYVRSVDRLYAMERESKRSTKSGETHDVPELKLMSPALEWWVENFSLFSDVVTRRYPFTMVSYEAVLEDRERTLQAVFDWLGEGDVEAAIAQVEPSLRTQEEAPGDSRTPVESGLEPEVIEVFDELHRVVRAQEAVVQPFVDRLNQTNERLRERIQQAVRETARSQLERRKAWLEKRRSSQAST